MQIKVNFLKDSFSPGDLLQGDLLLSITDRHHYDISGIYLQLQGFERVRFRRRAETPSAKADTSLLDDPFLDWENENSKTVSSGIPTILPISQPHFSQSVLINTIHPITRHRAKLQRGLHSFPFALSLPSKLPPSINFTSGSKYSASVEYSITIQVFPQTGKSDGILSLTFPIKILHNKVASISNNSHVNTSNNTHKSPFPFIDQGIRISHAFCFCLSSKELNFFASWSRNAFSPGQEAQLVLRLSLATGSRSCKLKVISVKLVRELILSVEGQSFRTVDPITKAKFSVEGTLISDSPGFELGTTTVLTIPSTLQEPTCKTASIDCRYFFVFEVDFKLFDSVLLAAEVIIL